MTKQKASKLLPLITAFANGEQIQYYRDNDWFDGDNFNFENDPVCYRIKPKIRPLRFNDLENGDIFCYEISFDNWGDPCVLTDKTAKNDNQTYCMITQSRDYATDPKDNSICRRLNLTTLKWEETITD